MEQEQRKKQQHNHYYKIENAQLPSIEAFSRKATNEFITEERGCKVSGNTIQECIEALNFVAPDLIKNKKRKC